MIKIKWETVIGWIFLSFFISILLFIQISFFTFNPFSGSSCVSNYYEDDQIFFTDMDYSGNVYLIVEPKHYYFDYTNSTYPYPTTLPPIPIDATHDIYAIAKFSPNMDLIWSRLIGGASNTLNFEIAGVEITPDNGLLIVTIGDSAFDSSLVDYSYGDGTYASYIMKFGENGGLEHLTEFKKASPFGNAVLIEEDGSTVIFQDFIEDDRFQKRTFLTNSTTQESVINLKDSGEVNWVTYLPNIEIYDTEINNGRLGIFIRDIDLLIANTTVDFLILELNILAGDIYSTEEIDPSNFPPFISDNFILGSSGSEFVVAMTDEDFQLLYVYNNTSKSYTSNIVFLQPADTGFSQIIERRGLIFISSFLKFPPSSSLLGNRGTEIIWNDQILDLYFVVFDSSGDYLYSLRILSEHFDFYEQNVRFSYLNGMFIVTSVLSSPPFDTIGSFQSEPLGSTDPFIAVINGEQQKGSFYGNVGIPVTTCLA